MTETELSARMAEIRAEIVSMTRQEAGQYIEDQDIPDHAKLTLRAELESPPGHDETENGRRAVEAAPALPMRFHGFYRFFSLPATAILLFSDLKALLDTFDEMLSYFGGLLWVCIAAEAVCLALSVICVVGFIMVPRRMYYINLSLIILRPLEGLLLVAMLLSRAPEGMAGQYSMQVIVSIVSAVCIAIYYRKRKALFVPLPAGHGEQDGGRPPDARSQDDPWRRK